MSGEGHHDLNRHPPSAASGGHAINRSQFLIAIAIGSICSALVLLTAHSALNQLNTLDPFVYAAYIHDYPTTLARFGRTYYSTRIAFIYPQIALTHLFGIVGGYYTFRFLALTAAASAVFILGLRYFNYRVAVLATAWLCFTIWLPRSLLWTYYDGTAVVYLLLAITTLLAPVRRRVSTYAAAGSVFALAVNCNVTTLAVGGLLAPGFLLVYRRQGHISLVVSVLAILAGFCLTYLVLAGALYLEFPEKGFFFEDVTIKFATWMIEGGAATWFKPLSFAFLQMRFFSLLIPIVLFLGSLLLLIRSKITQPQTDRTDFALIAVLYLGCLIALFLFLHFIFHVGLLSLPYYISYLIPGCILAFLVICAETERLAGRAPSNTTVIIGVCLFFLVWLAPPSLTEIVILSMPYFWVALSIAAIALFRMPRIAPWAFVVWAAIMPLSFQQSSFYSDMATTDPKTEWDVYRGAIFLQKFVNSQLQPNQPIGFWYRNGDRHTALDSVQSIFLWGYSRLPPSPKQNAGMPVVDDAFKDALSSRRFVVLLGMTSDEIDAGLTALGTAGISYRVMQDTSFQGQVWGYKATLIALAPT